MTTRKTQIASWPAPHQHMRLNPARQAKKATGLHGRQWVKHRKAVRRAAKASTATSPATAAV